MNPKPCRGEFRMDDLEPLTGTAPKSPFDVPGIKTKATTRDILEAVRESRRRES